MIGEGATSPGVLDLRRIDFRHPGAPWLFRSFDLDVSAGEVVALVGPSGCGKSTLLRIAAGLTDVDGGARHCRATTISQVFQSPRLLPWRNAVDNVHLPLELGPRREARANATSGSDRAMDLLERVGLGESARLAPAQLSLGMQMRVALARALAPAPEFMLLDEPFAAVDEPTRLRLNRLFVEMVESSGCSALYVTHSAREAATIADRIVVLGSAPHGVDAEFSLSARAGRSAVDIGDAERAIIDRLDSIIDGGR